MFSMQILEFPEQTMGLFMFIKMKLRGHNKYNYNSTTKNYEKRKLLIWLNKETININNRATQL